MKNQIKSLTLSISEIRQLIAMTDKASVDEALQAIDEASANPDSVNPENYSNLASRTLATKFHKKADQRRRRQLRKPAVKASDAPSKTAAAATPAAAHSNTVTIPLSKNFVDIIRWIHARRDHLKAHFTHLIQATSPLLPSPSATDFLATLDLLLSLTSQAHPTALRHKSSAPSLRPHSLTLTTKC